jgi:membrane protease YdiL (CAAX protease family)
MSQSSSNRKQVETTPEKDVVKASRRSYRWWFLIVIPVWVFVGFMTAQLLIAGAFLAMKALGVSFATINGSVLSTVVAALVYILSVLIVLGLPWLLKKRITTSQDIGLTRLPTWTDLGLAPAGFILYVLVSGVIVYVIGQLFPGFNAAQTQDVGFSNLAEHYEYALAFFTLVVIAPFAEEILFRGYLYGKLRKSIPTWLAMVVTSALFGAIHAQWNVGVDVFVLSMVACSLREVTGGIWAGILLHMLKNGLAFYILFINPSFLVQ